MMQGIEVLNTYLVTTNTQFEAGMCFVIGGLFLILGFLLLYDAEPSGFFPLLLSIGMIVIGIVAWNDPGTTTTYYDVTISDEVNFNDFYEKYEVIEVNGQIYTLKLHEEGE